MKTNLEALKLQNTQRWKAMHMDPALSEVLDRVSERLVAPAAKVRYQIVEEQTKVPWHVIAVIHEREASQSWKANLAQGDRWDKRSIHIPKGRGPFHSWEDAAVDALIKCPPYAAKWKDWSIGGLLTLLEQYNGLGYAQRGLPSPYIFASTDQYHRGKFISDGHFDPHAIDHQLGCAALLARMMLHDHSIKIAE